MSADDIVVVQVGVPGPAGAGVTVSQYNSIISRLNALEAGTTGGVTVEDEGTPLSTQATGLNFTGAGVTASGAGATKTINVPGAGGSTVEVDSGTTPVVTAASKLQFDTNGHTVSDGGGGVAIITAVRAFDTSHPQYAQVFANAAMGNSETANTTNTSTWVPAKTLNWTLPAGHYTIVLFGAAILVSNDSSGGGLLRASIGGVAGTGVTSNMGLDNTTVQVTQARTGVVSDGSTATVVSLQFLSTTTSYAVNCYVPAFFVTAQRTL